MRIQQVVDDVTADTPGVTWSISTTGANHDPDRQLSTASIGKILLLIETAVNLIRWPTWTRTAVISSETKPEPPPASEPTSVT